MSSAIPETMQALRVPKAGVSHYSLETIPVPKATDTKVLLKLGASGLCHTDLMVLEGTWGGVYPLVGGHEPAGTVVALGDEAEKTDKVKLGDRVAALLPKDPCAKAGECPDCKLDWKFCPNIKFGGIDADGFFSEYALVEANHCVVLPDSMSFEQAAPLTCAGVTIYTAIKRANLKPGQIIAISGLGALGYLGVQFAKALGLKVVGVDARPEPIDSAKKLELAPNLIVDVSKTGAEEAKKEIGRLREDGYVGWDGADATILTTDAPSAQSYAMSLTRSHGQLIVVALPPEISINTRALIFSDITITGSLHGNEHDLKETIDLADKFGIKSDLSTFRIEEHERMVDSVHEAGRKGKNVLVF
ncbi:hypothetical protein CI109_105630 [Kwoniella shandongensis]|uniref:Uncharacterized protein n=1 Tax=Kwoniella shandongensis TaxID=1734106 RepID=A0A5M6C3D9_9TREE|nr:uncharacterized protein CI109_002346 [Kwoniella shandongensis]KAA5529453.1 hypothetical protein CI109_002346 [Kwoniella shandongensis]